MDYMTVLEASEKWNLSARRIQTLCNEGKVDGAIKFGREWVIPKENEKPADARIRSGKYIKSRKMDT